MSTVPAKRKLTTHHKFSVDDYYRMAEVGILGPEDCVELIGGEIIEMSPIGPSHAGIVNRLNALLTRQLANRAIVGVQNPARLNRYNEPQPDFTIARWRDDYYSKQHPQPKDLLLIIEVADSSLQFDRRRKLPRYAAAGIPEVWLVDIQTRSIEQFFQPSGRKYQERKVLARGEELRSISIQDLILATDDILG